MQGCVRRISMLCHSAPSCFTVLEPCPHGQVAGGSGISSSLEKIVLYVLILLSGNISKIIFSYLCINLPYDLSRTAFLLWCEWAKFSCFTVAYFESIVNSVVWAAAVLHEKRHQTVTEKRRAKTLLTCFYMSRLKLIWFVPSIITANSLYCKSKIKKVTKFFGRRKREDGGRVLSEILPYNCLSSLAFVVLPCETLLSRPRRTSWRNLQIVSASGLLKSCPCPDRSGLVSGKKR